MASKIKVDQLETADGTGTIALQNQLSGMTTASLPALGSAQMPTGSVLQVVSTGTIAEATTTSTSYVDSPLSLAITPSSTSSKIRVDACCPVAIWGAGSALRGGLKVLRGSTVIWNSGGSREIFQVRGTPAELNTVLVPIILDSPSSTSAVTYKIQYALNDGGSMKLYSNSYGTALILTEIAG